MPRKARQGARPKKKQARTRPQPAKNMELAGPSRESGSAPASIDAREEAGSTTRTVSPAAPAPQRPRATVRGTKPYEHRRGRKIATVRPVAAAAQGLPREREYAYIRSDLRRLIVTAAVLAVAMVALLVVLEP